METKCGKMEHSVCSKGKRRDRSLHLKKKCKYSEHLRIIDHDDADIDGFLLPATAHIYWTFDARTPYPPTFLAPIAGEDVISVK